MRHIAVLAREVCEYAPRHTKLYVDGTAGHGGHMQVMREAFSSQNEEFVTIGCDVDPLMLSKATSHLQEAGVTRFELLHSSYQHMADFLSQKGVSADYILLDLGINRDHILQADRGFSLKKDGPLDMRFSSEGPTAHAVIQSLHAEDMIDHLMQYGDFSPKRAEILAYYISKHKRNSLMKTTLGFKKILGQLKVGTQELARIFQVLRIVTNHELDQLEVFLSTFDRCVSPGGRCSIISYHSGEDRLVKNAFKKLSRTGRTIITDQPIVPTSNEVYRNKASRSAKMRVIQKN